MTSFNEYVSGEIKKRGWSMREVSRRAGLSHTTVTEVLNDNREPSWEFCAAIAKPLEVSPVRLFRMAGLLPDGDNEEMTLDELIQIMNRLTRQERENVLKFAWFLIRDRGANYDTDTD